MARRPEQWHLFHVSDTVQHRLISADSDSAQKAEELVTAAAEYEHAMDASRITCEHLGILDVDIDCAI
jgi:hypothetical protein